MAREVLNLAKERLDKVNKELPEDNPYRKMYEERRKQVIKPK